MRHLYRFGACSLPKPYVLLTPFRWPASHLDYHLPPPCFRLDLTQSTTAKSLSSLPGLLSYVHCECRYILVFDSQVTMGQATQHQSCLQLLTTSNEIPTVPPTLGLVPALSWLTPTRSLQSTRTSSSPSLRTPQIPV